MISTFDTRIPPSEACVVRPLLERWAEAQPEKIFVKAQSEDGVSYRAMRDRVAATAAALAALGVKHGDKVVVWMPNGVDCIRVWFAINWLGAVYVPINTAYKGHLLEHVLRNAGAKVMVAHASLARLLEDTDTAEVETVVVFGAPAPIRTLRVLPASMLDRADAAGPPEADIKPWDMQSIVYTSGTTGASKGVMSSYAHLHATSGVESFPMLTADDRFMCNLPLFHVGGTFGVMAMLSRGGSVSLVSSFSTEEFWPALRETGTTAVMLLGAMANFILKRPPGPEDRDHPLKKAIIVPLTDGAPAFAARFGVETYTIYNMTEISTPLVSEVNPSATGSCGRPRKGVTLRLVDENDCEVPQGSVGELVVRTDAPWALNSGYYKNPEATAAAWRNGWFHTGDAFRVDADGTYFFVDRMKDAIRRRGENISSFEVEAEIAAHPAVNEVAVVPVPSELTEEEVMCVVAPTPGQTIDPKELLDFLVPRMPHFMVPRYVRVVDALPKTPTQKIQKHILRAAGLTDDTWDREKAGMRIRRQKL
ncbi:MAG: AMP-binding protein [Alphaproteobacteria bacterium]|nr:AMP-binding protein [Alphaproteobacteria bacterium]